MKLVFKQLLLVAVLLVCDAVVAGPQEDLQRYQGFFKQRFPDMSLADLSFGMYMFSEDKRNQYNDIMEFPPYELAVEEGKELFNKPFANGKTYADCLPNGGIGIAHLYPKFNAKSGKVKTLPGLLNECREKNGEQPLNILKGELAKVVAYMADTSRGKAVKVEVPDDPRALAAYENGKQTYFTRRLS